MPMPTLRMQKPTPVGVGTARLYRLDNIVITIETCSADAEDRLDLQSERRHRHLRCRHFVASEEAEVDQKERDADQKNQMPTKRC